MFTCVFCVFIILFLRPPAQTNTEQTSSFNTRQSFVFVLVLTEAKLIRLEKLFEFFGSRLCLIQ